MQEKRLIDAMPGSTPGVLVVRFCDLGTDA
jgi:hypothetical protein